ncbi:MAG: phospholipase D family protein [Planctomycetota bacterium]
MRLIGLLALLAMLVGCDSSAPPQPSTATVARNDIDVYFSPEGGATDAIVSAVGQAQRSLDIAAYSFTSAPIAAAVRDAHRRGVRTRVILNRNQESHRYSSGSFLSNAGIPVHIRVADGVQHSKYMIIDGEVVITGSFNFSRRAEERNAENLLVLHRPDVAREYQADFDRMLAISRPFEDKRDDVSQP